MIEHKILAASTQRKGVKNFPNLESTFKFAQPRTRMTAVCLAVALYSPVNSN
jgi:hypothetical protein